MSFLINSFMFGGGAGVPTQSIDFDSSSSQYLSMTDANFGAYDRGKFAISLWFKRASIGGGAGQNLMGQWHSTSGSRAWYLQFTSANKIDFVTCADGTNINGRIATNAAYTDTSSYHHLMVWFDYANATAGDRMRLWIDGSEVTSFATDTNPTAAVADVTTFIGIAQVASGSAIYDGLIYQLGFFSGTLPAIGDVYDAGSPKDISGLPGLYSYLDCAGGDVTSDGVLAAAWTNNNSATASATIPT